MARHSNDPSMDITPFLPAMQAPTLRVIHVLHEPLEQSRRASVFRAMLDLNPRVQRAVAVRPDQLSDVLRLWHPDILLVDAELSFGELAASLNRGWGEGAPRVLVVGSSDDGAPIPGSALSLAQTEAALEAAEPTPDSHPRRYLDHLVIHVARKLLIVPVADILWLEAARSYVRVHTASGSWLHRESISRLEKRLDPEFFVRLHRRVMVHVASLLEVELATDGSYTAVLKRGQRLRIGRTYLGAFRQRLGRQGTSSAVRGLRLD